MDAPATGLAGVARLWQELDDGRIELIANEHGHRCTPSLIGNAAKAAHHTNPQNTVFAVNRFIGRTTDDPQLKEDIKRVPFQVIDEGGKPAIAVQHKNSQLIFTAEEITAMIFGKLKEAAEAYLGYTLTHAVVTVPASTKDAGAIAGLNILRIINEPTAAAIAYNLSKAEGESHTLVYNLDGGTLDVSLLFVEDGVFEILATSMKAYEKKIGKDISQNLGALRKLRTEAEKAKKTLSSQQSTRIGIKSFVNGHNFDETLTRDTFEELNMDLFSKSLKFVEQVLVDADVKKEEDNEACALLLPKLA
ncbi:heat shock protein 70 family [Pterulicium gracile]|uniref:non-chaperonin molecular chaperone ATPase n=1 Tax=Pterulicium gracile TaxID=1884261 RepID=A0A5C3Q4R7_9AGAR|nr:heat shock protein 70 family [Pterula gracilis]